MISSATPKATGTKSLLRRFLFPALVSLGILVFLVSGILLLPLLGFEADELMYVYNLWHPSSSVAWFSFFHHLMPSMLMSYVGALKSWIYAPILASFGPSTWTIRLPVLLLACFTIYLSARLLRAIDSRLAALIGVWLLATNMTFLLTAVFDWGPVVLQNLLLVAGLLVVERWAGKPRQWLLFCAGLIFGLALWDKALFLWNFSGMALALIIVNAKAIVRAFTLKSALSAILLAILGLSLGAYPLLRYNAKKGHSTVGENAHLSTSELSHKARFLWYAGNDGIAATFPADGKYPAPDRNHHPLEKLSMEIAGPMATNSSSWRSWLAVIAIPIGLIAAVGRRRKWILFFLVSAIISWFQSAITVNAGGSIHHSVLLWPLLYFALALSLAAIANLTIPLARPLIILVVVIFCIRGILVINRGYANMMSFSPIVQWSNADTLLGQRLENAGIRRAIVTDWGIGAVVAVRTRDEVSIDDQSWQLMDSHYDENAFSNCRAPECVVISHAPGRAVMEKAAAGLDQGIKSLHLRRSGLSTISDTHGTPTFQLFRLEPDSGEAAAPVSQ
jgi:4-amino-4-deoxy-L-arabinose transferase-like glycosyltransferase